MDYDVIVVGSGFGGAPVALRAAQAGLRVCVLEKGRRMSHAEFARMAAGERPLFHVDGVQMWGGRLARHGPGVIEFRLIQGLASVSGCAVGGGSHHYTSVTIPAPDEVFSEGWPADWTAASVRPFYERVAERLRPAPIIQPAAQTLALESLAIRLGARSARLPLAVDWQPARYVTPRLAGATPAPQHGWRFGLATWLQGNGATNKITLDEAYLCEAEACGAHVRPLHSVTRIIPESGGYRVEFTRLEGSGFRVQGSGPPTQDSEFRTQDSITTRCLVLSAGTVATVQLLLRARDVHRTLPALSPALGERFSTNGDDGVLLVGPRLPLEGGPAPAATAWLDYWESDRAFLMELGVLPLWRRRLTKLLPVLLCLRDRRWGGRGRRSAVADSCRASSPHAWIIGAFGFDHSPGRLFLDNRARMRHITVHDDGGLSRRIRRRLRELSAAAGATLLTAWNLPGKQQAVTVHPLGGCVLADSPQRGVCDPSGQVYGYPHLYVTDGSVLPTATGRPPSMTIAAIAERVAEGLVRRL